MLAALTTPRLAAPCHAQRCKSAARPAPLVCRAGDNHVSAAHNEPVFVPMPSDMDWDELPSVMSVDAETARQSLISIDDFMAPPPPAQPVAQEGGDKASFLHVWQSSYCDNETARNSMESIDVFLE